MKQLIDQDGNEIPTPPADSDVARLIYLMEYCRRRRFRIGPLVQVGDTVAQVVDPTLDEARKNTPEGDIWEEHGHSEG